MTVTPTRTLPLATGTWSPDPVHSSVGFTVRHLGLSKVRGRFAAFEAQLVVGEDLETSSVTADVDLSSVDTGNPDRDGHLKSPDFLDVEANPSMTFASTAIREDGGDYVLVGDLTLNDVTRSVTFDVELTGTVVDQDGVTHAGFNATTEISRKEFNVKFEAQVVGDAVLVADKVKVELDLQFLSS